MVEDSSASQVNGARDALALLSRLIYRKYGAEALPLIAEVWHKLGASAGNSRKQALDANDLETVCSTFFKGIADASEKRVRLIGYKCPLGLENAGRELCQAMMHIDKGMLEAGTGRELNMEIRTTVAAGDECCEVIFSVPE